MTRVHGEVQELLCSHYWHFSRFQKYHARHVNLQELRALLNELWHQASGVHGNIRLLNLCDSRVVVGAWAKGRSSSRRLNALIKRAVGPSLCSRVSIINLWVDTHHNPGDAPSRQTPLSPPAPLPPWARENLDREDLDFFEEQHTQYIRKCNAAARANVVTDDAKLKVKNFVCRKTFFPKLPSTGAIVDVPKATSIDIPVSRSSDTYASASRHYPSSHASDSLGDGRGNLRVPNIDNNIHNKPSCNIHSEWTFREIFCGKAGLSKSMKRAGFTVAPPFDAYIAGHYRRDYDILDETTYHKLCELAKLPYQLWHFGVPCESFSLLNVNLNGGSRTAAMPEGNGSLPREVKGNMILNRVLGLVKIINSAGSKWSIENPHSSFLFKQAKVRELLGQRLVFEVVLDQCEYGLTFPDCHEHQRCKKTTRIIGNIQNLYLLDLKCKGDHQHVHAIGSVMTPHGSQKRSRLAGAYPLRLCRAWAAALASEISYL